jgi:hypothetical protein
MLILEGSQGCDGRTGGSVTISLRNFVGEGIKSSSNDNSLNRKPFYEKYILISLYHAYVDNSKLVKYNIGSLNYKLCPKLLKCSKELVNVMFLE